MKISKGNDAASISASLYKQELNELKIEKLGNKITIISFILPCLIGAILFYVYMDINNRVVDAKDSGKSEIQMMAQDVEAQLNAMNVEVARLKFSLEQELPAITARIEELGALKANREETLASLGTLEKEVANTAEQYKSAIHIIDRTSRENLSIINKTGDRLQENATAFEERITQQLETAETNFKVAMAAVEGKITHAVSTVKNAVESDLERLESLNLNLASYETTIKTLGEDLKLAKTDFNTRLKQTVQQDAFESLKARMHQKVEQKDLEKALKDLKAQLTLRLSRLEKEMANPKISPAKAAPHTRATPPGATSQTKNRAPALKQKKPKPEPPLIITVPEPGKILEGDLSQ